MNKPLRILALFNILLLVAMLSYIGYLLFTEPVVGWVFAFAIMPIWLFNFIVYILLVTVFKQKMPLMQNKWSYFWISPMPHLAILLVGGIAQIIYMLCTGGFSR